ncbi:LysR family transcriptional regulator [Oleiagrimonas sp. C23AA]|uniref:LysR family transcriptional regulator n=1 Tax=Oleiagrimonas sp. C23AA TaxID=2719047 RepID=UPI001422A349|nr:LysR family transcriptional regulator [Oleiagrimonas sp. C23AA]NII09676.1 LysR family transcriptional regulator [Oleiagrimonas sp. C23AA]
MDIKDLMVFEAVSRHGRMNRAAAELHTVQSNVTARIRSLEDELGVKLFQRHARGVTTTPAGERMQPYIGRLQKLMADAKAAARDDGAPHGNLVVGSLETTTAIRLSPFLGRFAQAFPDVHLIVRTGTTRKLLEDVIEGRLECAFVAGPVHHPALRQHAAFQEDMVLVTPRTIRTAADLAMVRDLKSIVFQSGCSYRQRLEYILTDMGILTCEPLEFGSLDAILSCVAAGVGVTLLPRGVVARAWQEGRIAVHELPPEHAQVQTVLIQRHDAYVSSAMRAFVEMAQKSPEA